MTADRVPGTLLPVGDTEARGAVLTHSAQKPREMPTQSPYGVLSDTEVLGAGQKDKALGFELCVKATN